MTRFIVSLTALVVLATSSCARDPGVPPPTAPDREKQDHCAKLSADTTVGCAACAGISYCGWKQTTSPVDGTCHYVEKPSSDATLVTDPQNCPKPPE